MFLPDNSLEMDKEVLKFLLLQKKSTALNFKATKNEKNLICITLTKDALNNEEKNKKIKHTFKSDISLNLDTNTICFDEYGRVFKNEVSENLNSLIKENVIISLTYKNKQRKIIIYKITGDIE